MVKINYTIAQDWSGDWAIFFRVLLGDDANAKRLRDVAAIAHVALVILYLTLQSMRLPRGATFAKRPGPRLPHSMLGQR